MSAQDSVIRSRSHILSSSLSLLTPLSTPRLYFNFARRSSQRTRIVAMEMDEVINFYVPGINPDAAASDLTSDHTAVAASIIAFSSFLVFCTFKHRWLVNVKCSFCSGIARLWRGGLDWWFCNHCKRINGYLKKRSAQNEWTSSIEKSNENARDVNCSGTMISNKLEKTTSDEVSLLRYAPDNSIYYVKNNLHKSTDNVDHLSKILENNFIRNDLNMQLKPLDSEKKLCSKTNQSLKLESPLLRDYVTENATRHRSSSQGSIFNKSFIAIRRRSSFFSSTFNLSNSFKDLNPLNKKKSSEADLMKAQVASLEDQFSALRKMHVKEISSLALKMNEKKEAIRKLEELNANILQLHQQIQQNVQLQRKESNTSSAQLQELYLMKRRHKQVLENVTELENDLTKDMERIQTLKHLLDQDFQRRGEMSIINEESDACERTSALQHEISKLNKELEHYKEENERLNRENARLRVGVNVREQVPDSSQQVLRLHLLPSSSSSSSCSSLDFQEEQQQQQRNDLNGEVRRGPRIVKLVKAGQRPRPANKPTAAAK